MMPCSDVVGYHCFRGPCCLHLQGETAIVSVALVGLVYFVCSIYFRLLLFMSRGTCRWLQSMCIYIISLLSFVKKKSLIRMLCFLCVSILSTFESHNLLSYAIGGYPSLVLFNFLVSNDNMVDKWTCKWKQH